MRSGSMAEQYGEAHHCNDENYEKKGDGWPSDHRRSQYTL
jgi:hypothetical protein